MNLFDLIVRKALQKNVLELVDGKTYVFFVPDNAAAAELMEAFKAVFGSKSNPPKVLIIPVDSSKGLRVITVA